jgi:hypothetical protein
MPIIMLLSVRAFARLTACTSISSPDRNVSELSYFTKAAISMIGFLKQSCMESSKSLCFYLRTLATAPSHADGDGDGDSGIGGTAKGHQTPDASPDKGLMRGTTPFSQQRGPLTPSAVARRNGAVSEEQVHGKAGASKPIDVQKLNQTAETLKAAVSASFLPTLRRLVLGGDELFIAHLSSIVELLPTTRIMCEGFLFTCLYLDRSISIDDSPFHSAKGMSRELEESVALVEQACLICLETVSQVPPPSSSPTTSRLFLTLSASSPPDRRRGGPHHRVPHERLPDRQHTRRSNE